MQGSFVRGTARRLGVAVSLLAAVLPLHAQTAPDGLKAVIEAAAAPLAPLPALTIENAKAWGPLAGLSGSYWFEEASGEIKSYAWTIPGEVMQVTADSERGHSVLTQRLNVLADGVVATAADGSTSQISAPREDLLIQSFGSVRQVSRFKGDRRLSQFQKLENGQWIDQGSPAETVRISKAQADAALAMLAQKRQAAAADAERSRAALRSQWGILPDAVGFWHQAGGGAIQVFPRADKDGYQVQLYSAGMYMALSFHIHRPGGTRLAVDDNEAVLYPDGSIGYDAGFLEDDGALRMNNGKLEYVTGRLGKDGFLAQETVYSTQRSTKAETEALQKRIAVASAALAKAQAEADDDDDDFLGSLFVMGTAMAGAAAGGGDTSQVLGAAMQGAAIANPDSPMAGALSEQGLALMTGGNGGLAGMTGGGLPSSVGGNLGVGGGGAGGASYAAKPNLTPAICNRISASGDDVQLSTMCAQSSSLYAQYLNAIAQGYSESDSNRTYEAHRQAATVAGGWARDAAASR